MPTWILLRGLARESGHWDGFPLQLGHHLQGARVLALDLPGNGALHGLASPTQVAGMVASVRDQLHALGEAPPWNVLALSLGGMVAVEWARAFPQEVAAQVLVNTSMRPFSPFYQRLRPANYPTLLGLILPGAHTASRERAILRMTSRSADGSVLAHWEALARRHPVAARNAMRQLLAAARFSAPAQAPAPTLLLASACDALVSVQCSVALARQWSCPLRMHPTAGHDLPLDDGAWVAQQVAEWLHGVYAVGCSASGGDLHGCAG